MASSWQGRLAWTWYWLTFSRASPRPRSRFPPFLSHPHPQSGPHDVGGPGRRIWREGGEDTAMSRLPACRLPACLRPFSPALGPIHAPEKSGDRGYLRRGCRPMTRSRSRLQQPMWILAHVAVSGEGLLAGGGGRTVLRVLGFCATSALRCKERRGGEAARLGRTSLVSDALSPGIRPRIRWHATEKARCRRRARPRLRRPSLDIQTAEYKTKIVGAYAE